MTAMLKGYPTSSPIRRYGPRHGYQNAPRAIPSPANDYGPRSVKMPGPLKVPTQLPAYKYGKFGFGALARTAGRLNPGIGAGILAYSLAEWYFASPAIDGGYDMTGWVHKCGSNINHQVFRIDNWPHSNCGLNNQVFNWTYGTDPIPALPFNSSRWYQVTMGRKHGPVGGERMWFDEIWTKWNGPSPQIDYTPPSLPRYLPRLRPKERVRFNPPRVNIQRGPAPRVRDRHNPRTWSPTAPPPPRTRERKFSLTVGGTALGSLFGTLTETGDFIDSLYEALPCAVRGGRMIRRAYGTAFCASAPRSMADKAKMVWDNLGDVDIAFALENLLINEAKDWFFSRVGRKTRDANRRLSLYGGRVQVGLGPAI